MDNTDLQSPEILKAAGLCGSTFVKVGHLAWIACLDHLWVFLKVSLPDFQHRHGLLPVRPDCLIRDAVWQAPGYKSESLALSQVMLTKASVLEVSSSTFDIKSPKAQPGRPWCRTIRAETGTCGLCLLGLCSSHDLSW